MPFLWIPPLFSNYISCNTPEITLWTLYNFLLAGHFFNDSLTIL